MRGYKERINNKVCKAIKKKGNQQQSESMVLDRRHTQDNRDNNKVNQWCSTDVTQRTTERHNNKANQWCSTDVTHRTTERHNNKDFKHHNVRMSET